MLKDSAIRALCASFARTLRLERERQELSMNALAQKAGLSQQMVSYIERGLRVPTLDTLFRLSFALELELPTLLRRAVIAAAKN